MFVEEMLTLGHSPLVIDDDFVRWQFMPDTYFPEIILYWELVHFEMMHSHRGIPTLLIDIDIPPPVYDCCFRWIIESLTPRAQSSYHTWSDLATHSPLIHPHISYIGHCYTCTHLIRVLHLLSSHISSSYMTLFISFVIRGGCILVLSFLVEFSHAFGH